MKEKNKFIGYCLLGEAKKKGAYRDHAVVEDR
jgi:hypothetical protein